MMLKDEELLSIIDNDVALMSIKPVYAEAIMSGKKKYEFRRGRIKKDIAFILIYASSPIKAIVGFVRVEEIISGSPAKLWQYGGKHGGISHRDFKEYFDGRDVGQALKLKEIYEFDEPISPYDIFENFYPPQSFMYAEDYMLKKIYRYIKENNHAKV